MDESIKEMRPCERFFIPGATLRYKIEGILFSGKYSVDCYPVFDMSCGELRFLHPRPIKTDARVTLSIVIPGEDTPLVLRGRVSSTLHNPGKSYNYQICVYFEPYCKEKGKNDPCDLLRVMTLEEQFRLTRQGLWDSG